MTRAKTDWLYPTVHIKDQVLRNVFGGIILDSFGTESLTESTLSGYLAARSGIFFIFVEFVYWSCDLKFVYPTINLAFLVLLYLVHWPLLRMILGNSVSVFFLCWIHGVTVIGFGSLRRQSSIGWRFNPHNWRVTIQEYLTLVPGYG